MARIDFANPGTGGNWDGAAGRGECEGCAPGQAPAALSSEEIRAARLIRTIEAEIVPRLVLTRRVSVTPPSPARAEMAKIPDFGDVKELVRLLLVHDVGVASAFAESVRQRGVSLDGICLNLLAPAAQELGLLWEEDECDFMQVTVGLCRLHQVLRELSPHFNVDSIELCADKRVLLASMPGEQHTFGISLVAQYLRRAGWDVWQEYPTCSADILDIMRQNSFTVVGLSVGIDSRLDEVQALIQAIRNSSKNRAVGVLVGGPVLVARPEIATSIGADATAKDGLEAVNWAEIWAEVAGDAHQAGH
jgi:methanogenic corrinoid protein MtbC1